MWCRRSMRSWKSEKQPGSKQSFAISNIEFRGMTVSLRRRLRSECETAHNQRRGGAGLPRFNGHDGGRCPASWVWKRGEERPSTEAALLKRLHFVKDGGLEKRPLD